MTEDNPRPRVVFDCMVYLQATVSETGPAAALLQLVEIGAVSLFVSNEILDEVRDVLSRPKIRQKNPSLTDERVNALIIRLTETATVVGEISQHFPYERDPKDEKYINLAVEVGAEYLVSRDTDLLDLMKGETAESASFRERFTSLKVVDPVTFLTRVST